MKKRFIIGLLALITTTTITACGASSDYADSMAIDYNSAYDASSGFDGVAEEASYDYAPAEPGLVSYSETSGTKSAEVKTTENATNTNRKLIKNVSLSVETKEYDSIISNLSSTIEDMGGYIEYMDVYNGSSYGYNSTQARNATLTVRIPALKLSSFINVIGEQSNITSRTETVKDITLSYVDMESHKNMLITERDHLTELLNQAETIEDMITIEDRLTYVRYQIDSMESQLRTYDNQVDFSTVDINIREVIEYTPTPTVTYSTWERISMGFKQSLKDVGEGIKEFFIGFIIVLPHLVIWAIVIAIIIFIFKALLNLSPKHREKAKNKKAAKKERKAAKKTTESAQKTETPNDSLVENSDSSANQ